jgi:hypothetical protein
MDFVNSQKDRTNLSDPENPSSFRYIYMCMYAYEYIWMKIYILIWSYRFYFQSIRWK